MGSNPRRRRGEVAAEGRELSLLRLVQDLGAQGVPLCREFAEMMLVDVAADAPELLRGGVGAQLMDEPVTEAEMTAACVVAGAAAYARDAQLDDAALFALMARATVYAARFESYLVERTIF
jgi:hypothetical protein